MSTSDGCENSPKATIIITAYNMERYIAQTVDSVVQQTFQEWEVLVIDDGSVDKTACIVEPYTQRDPRVKLISRKNDGVCSARDEGANLASSEYILFLDGDDFLEPDCLQVLVTALEANPSAVGSYGLPKAIDEFNNVICDKIDDAFGATREKVFGDKHAVMADSEPTTLATMCIWDFISTPGQVLIRKSAFLITGGHFRDIPHSEDWDLWLRLCLIGDFIFVRKFVMTKRERLNSRSKHWPSMGLAEPIIRERLASILPMSAEQRQIARNAHKYSCLYRLGWAKDTIKSDGLVPALKQVVRAGRSYIQFLKTNYDFKNVT